MNIFMLDENIQKNAEYMVDKHIVKMPLESAQMLCTVLWGSGKSAPYKPTHRNHPCTIWAGNSLSNWRYLKNVALAICKEYTFRYGKVHKSQLVIESLEEPNIKDVGLTEMPICMDDCYKIGKNVISSYRNYYKIGKAHIHQWKNRNKPYWI